MSRLPTGKAAPVCMIGAMSDLAALFSLDFPPWQMVLRGTVVYWALLVVFRFLLRRDIGSMGMADLLFVVLVADAASNAMQGEYKSIGDGLVLLSTLVGWNVLLDWLSYRFEVISRLLEPPAQLLVRHGKPMHRILRRQKITLEELAGKLREQGVERIEDVRVAWLESDGQLSVFKYERRNDDAPKAQRRSARPGDTR
jgi:uncharacterized membrane protein YcaP (DUF421 family)